MEFKVGDKIINKGDSNWVGEVSSIIELNRSTPTQQIDDCFIIRVDWSDNQDNFDYEWFKPSEIELDPQTLRDNKLIELGI